MSYSFSVRGATRLEVTRKIAAELDTVVASQPIHSADRSQALAAAEAFIAVLRDASDQQDYSVSVSGTIGYTGNSVITSASVSVSVSLVAKEKAQES
jgi:hypothetical protein